MAILNGGHLGFFQALLGFFPDFFKWTYLPITNPIYIYHKPHNDRTQKHGLSQQIGLKHARKVSN